MLNPRYPTNEFDWLRDDLEAVFDAAAKFTKHVKATALACRPPLRVLFRAARAGHGIRKLTHLNFLRTVNASLDYFAADLMHNIYSRTRGYGYEDTIALKLPVSLTDRKWQDMVNDYAAFMHKHDLKALQKVLSDEFGIDLASFDNPDYEFDLSADPQEQHGAGYYGFLKELPAWKKIESLLQGTGIGADLVFDRGMDDNPIIMLAFFTRSGRPISTVAWWQVREDHGVHQVEFGSVIP